MHTDAATLESAWVSAKGKYLNLGIILRTGMDNGLDSKQKIGIVPVGEVEHENGHNVHILRFFHDQNGVPQFYNSRTYGSVNLSQYHAGDTVRLLFNTYSGETVHNFPL